MSIFKKVTLIFAYFVSMLVPSVAAESINRAGSVAELDEDIIRRIGFGRGP